MKLLLTFSLLLLLSFGVSSQDLIIKHDSLRIEAKVLEISETEIKFKNPELLEGPTFVVKKSEVHRIKYPNGQETVFEARPTAPVKSPSVADVPAIAPAPTAQQTLPEKEQAKASAAEIYNTGQIDAVNLYDAKGHFWAMAITTLLTAGVGGVVVGGLMAAFPPDVHYHAVSDRKLLSDQSYRNGYKKQAYRKKIANITAGFSVGITALFIIVLTSSE